MEKIRNLSSEGLSEFLLGRGVKKEVVEALRNEDVDGSMFATWEMPEYEALQLSALTKAQIINLCKIQKVAQAEDKDKENAAVQQPVDALNAFLIENNIIDLNFDDLRPMPSGETVVFAGDLETKILGNDNENSISLTKTNLERKNEEKEVVTEGDDLLADNNALVFKKKPKNWPHFSEDTPLNLDDLESKQDVENEAPSDNHSFAKEHGQDAGKLERCQCGDCSECESHNEMTANKSFSNLKEGFIESFDSKIEHQEFQSSAPEPTETGEVSKQEIISGGNSNITEDCLEEVVSKILDDSCTDSEENTAPNATTFADVDSIEDADDLRELEEKNTGEDDGMPSANTRLKSLPLKDNDLNDPLQRIKENESKKTTKKKKEKGRTRRSVQLQSVRPFFKPVSEKLSYFQGRFLKHENSSVSILEPSREFKKFSGVTMDNPEKFEKALVKKVAPFIIGCMNRRCNGTIYFGVLDDHKKGEDYAHGKIQGVELPIQKREMIQSIIDKNFTSSEAKQFKGLDESERNEILPLVRMCLNNVQFIPVNKNPERVVFEIDIQPSYENIKEPIIFSVCPEEQKEPTIYLRDGAASRKVLLKDVKQLETDVLQYLSDRRDQEKRLREGEQSLQGILRQEVCCGYQELNDSDFNFCLITNITEDEISLFPWLQNVAWRVIFDFNHDTRVTGIKKLLDKKFPAKIKYTITADLQSDFQKAQADEDFEFSKGMELLYINCNEENLEYAEWYRKSKNSITKAFEALISKKFPEKNRVIILIILANSQNLDMIAQTCKEFYSLDLPKYLFKCFHNDKEIEKTFMRSIGDIFNNEWKKMFNVKQWEHLSNFMQEVIRNQDGDFNLKVPCSNGTNFPLPEDYVSFLMNAGVTIIGANHCEDLKREDLQEAAEFETVAFLKGETPNWSLFFFNDQSCSPVNLKFSILERKMLTDIKDAVKESCLKNACVTLIEVVHEPGSGATTLGRQALWHFRKEMRCIALNALDFIEGDKLDPKELEKLADNILDVRKRGEEEEVWLGKTFTPCKTMLILLDNSVPKFTKQLEKELHKQVFGSFEFTKTVFIILALHRNYDLSVSRDSLTQDQENDPHRKNNGTFHHIRLVLIQRLTGKEKEMFSKKLEDFLEKRDLNVIDIMSFVIMATNNDEDNEYVKKVVKEAILHLNHFKLQQQLLMTLALFKYFGDMGLPSYACRSMIVSQIYLNSNIFEEEAQERTQFISYPGNFKENILRPQVRQFISEGKAGRFDLYDHMSVTHLPVAKHIYENLIQSDETLSSLVIAMMESVLDSIEKCNQTVTDEIHASIRKLLVKRSLDHGEKPKKGKFSRLIELIVKEDGKDEAVNVLREGYHSVTDNVNKAYIAQALARLFIEHNEFDNAITVAKTAIDHLPDAFVMHDTLGQAYKRKGRHLQQNDEKKQFREFKDVIKNAMTTEKCFQKARKCYEESTQRQGKSNKIDISNDFEESAANEPGLMGWVESNLHLLLFLFKNVTELQETETRLFFMKFLKNEVTIEHIAPLFPNEEEWKDIMIFFSEVYKNTRQCLETATRKLAYIDPYQSSSSKLPNHGLKILRENVELLNKVFGEDGTKKASGKALSLQEKLYELRVRFIVSLANCFGWVVKNYEEDKVREFEKRLMEMLKLTRENNNLKLRPEDKIVYINIAFVLIYNNKKPQLKWNLVDTFCTDLIKAKVNAPEPYFFYIMMHWPQDGKLKDCDELETIQLCQEKLKEIEFEYPEFSPKFLGNRKPKTLFFLSPGTDFNRITSDKRAKSVTYKEYSSQRANYKFTRKDNLVLRISGVLDERKNVDIEVKTPNDSLVKDNRLQLRSAFYYYRGRDHIENVTFKVGFTFGGPVAYDVKEAEFEGQRDRRERFAQK